ncbi:MAG TPA: SDR family NAD(P)-dependent oxidoreductase [Sandaracinaceae bacterium LLY-WYZ-13_1]|nr:SDR family NAD(P)-dependent oxidoreductase [Sandaracinaceae bacterium LLY-WYZ-13_1]
MSARTVVVTGANTGVGRATAEALAARGDRLVLACRRPARAAPVRDAIVAAGGRVDVVALDLGDLASVRRAAAEVTAIAPRVDVLINNAGVGGARGRTRDGFELAFGVNHLGHFLWTRLLAPAVVDGGRVVHVVSGSHERVDRVDWDRLRGPTRSWTGVREYAVSKLCQLLFHHELARRAPRLSSLAADPGDVASDGWRHVPWPVRPLLKCGMASPAQGAQTPVFCASSPALEGVTGRLYAARRERAPSPIARDAALARELWARSEAWVSGR